MVAAFLDSWMTGDADEDSVTMEYDRPSRQEVASVVGLAARLYLGGAGAPRRYFAWGQAVRGAALAVVLVHATQGLAGLTLRPLGAWSSWFLFDFGLVLGMAAFHWDAPPAARRPWLLALPGYFL